MKGGNKMNFETPVKELYGVGEKTEKYLHSGGLFTVKDLIYHLPRAYQNRGDIVKIKSTVKHERHKKVCSVFQEYSDRYRNDSSP
jgi:RecG-like helicase